MKSTSAEATIIQAVSAPFTFGGSAARASGACSRTETAKPRTPTTKLRAFMHPPLFLENTALCDVFGVEAEGSAPAICEPVLEGEADRTEGDLLPRDLAFFHHCHFECLFAGLEFEVPQPRPVVKVHLVHPRH